MIKAFISIRHYHKMPLSFLISLYKIIYYYIALYNILKWDKFSFYEFYESLHICI